MKIETKFNIDDTVWFMHKEKPTTKTVRSMKVHSGKCLVGITDPLIEYDFNEHDAKGYKDEKQLFPTKEELLQSL